MIEYRLDGPDDYNNVQVISLSATDVQTMVKQSTKLLVTVTRRSLSTSMQPVSVVVTGGFDFDSVIMNDNANGNEEDNPKKIITSFKMFIGIGVLIFMVILVVV